MNFKGFEERYFHFPYTFIGLGDMDANFANEFIVMAPRLAIFRMNSIGFGGPWMTNSILIHRVWGHVFHFPFEFVGFGDMYVNLPYEFIRLGGMYGNFP